MEGWQLNDCVKKTVEEGDSVGMVHSDTQKVFNKVRLKKPPEGTKRSQDKWGLLSWLYSCPRRMQRGRLNGQLWHKVTARCSPRRAVLVNVLIHGLEIKADESADDTELI